MTVTIQQLLARSWRVPADGFRVVAADGVAIVGSRLGDASAERPALVLVHGLFGWHRKTRFARFAESLTPWFTVYVMDLRGHGASAGTTSYGDREIEDVEATVRLAREEGHKLVASMGTSLGAIAVVRHAGLVGGVDAVVAISGLARWGRHHMDHPGRAPAWKRMRSVTESDFGRRFARAYGVRLPVEWRPPEAPEEVVGKIGPTPLVIVHGRDDHLFGEDEARRLFDAANQPKRLLLAERFGHAEDGLRPALAHRLARELCSTWRLPWRG